MPKNTEEASKDLSAIIDKIADKITAVTLEELEFHTEWPAIKEFINAKGPELVAYQKRTLSQTFLKSAFINEVAKQIGIAKNFEPNIRGVVDALEMELREKSKSCVKVYEDYLKRNKKKK